MERHWSIYVLGKDLGYYVPHLLIDRALSTNCRGVAESIVLPYPFSTIGGQNTGLSCFRILLSGNRPRTGL